MLRIALFALFLIPALCVVNPTQATLDENDNNVLRLALTLKLLSTTYFDHFQELYTRQAFIDGGLPGSVWDNLDLLRQQEEYHANLLQSSLVARTGQKLDVCQYNFSTVNSVYDYIGGGRLLANVGTSAYVGLFASIYNRTLQQVAATVATVEARHASYLNQVPGNITLPSPVPNAASPFPNATDPAYSPQTVTDYVAPFIISCPFNVTANFPVVYTVIPVADPNTTVASNPTQDQVNANDITALNYLLSLEYIQVALFTYLGTPNFTQANFTNANYSVSDYQLLQTIRSHTNNHVAFLRGHVTQRGGTPSANCTYSLAKFVNSTATFVGLAQQISNTLVTAYDGAMNTITEPGLRQSVASVATVEARQAAFLNVLTGAPPFVSPLDTAALPSDVIALVNTSYINSCATPIQAPQTIVVKPYSNETTTTTGTPTSAPTASPTTQTGPTTPPVGTTSIGVTVGGTNGVPTQAPPLSTGGTTEGQVTSAANVLVRSVLAFVPPLFAVVVSLF